MAAEKFTRDKAPNADKEDIGKGEQDKLNDVEFFDLMQNYRIVPIQNQSRTLKRFEEVKDWIRANYKPLDEYDQLKAENEKVKRLLHDLTPGGSEFYNDPEYCAKWIRKEREESVQLLTATIKELKSDNEALKASNKELHGALSGLYNAIDSCIELVPSVILRAKEALNNNQIK